MTKRLSIFLIAVTLIFAVNAQSIMLRTANTGVSKSNDQFSGFQATFSYSQIESATITGTERGTFSVLTIAGAYNAGEPGTPELPVFRKMIQVPVDAIPKVVVKNFTATEYNLAEYGIQTIFPAQPDVRKDQSSSHVPFVYTPKAYEANEYTNINIAEINMLGTMRGVILGMLTVNPIQYNPSTNTIMVYNDIEVEVIFENANYKKTEALFVNTFSPYFKNVYEIVFNKGVTSNIYDDHPDLYSTPVHMLVVAHRMFEQTLQPWIEWKTKKGFYMDVNYIDDIGTTAAQIKAFIHDKYNDGANDGTTPTFIIIVGDSPQVPASQLCTAPGVPSNERWYTDLWYASVDGTFFPDMFYSRMSAQTTQQLANQIEKILYYERYEFADPTYLDNVLLIAGVDSYWNPRLAQPQINYAADNYFNAAHGYDNVHKYLTSPYTGCYAHLNNVGFANYTAHCYYQEWSDPRFSRSQISSLTNLNKYFVAMGNCCLAADFANTQHPECFGEAMVRAEKKGAVGYIGSSPSSYWGGDFHFSVGAYAGSINVVTTPTLENTTTGCYDFMFKDADFNTLCSYVFGGNLAVTYAYNAGYTTHVSAHYYWEAYNVLGDGSLMPYNAQAALNNVSHGSLPIGAETYEVEAVPGSYVAISKDGALLGVAVVNAEGTAVVPLNPPISSEGNVDIVVTRNQYIPYIAQIKVRLGVNEMQTASFEIFPNPASNSIVVKGEGLNRVELYDLQGRKLIEYNNINDNLQINVN
ncbi:MAG: C25 family cysteine peptidase, partial [Bacteroidetes bacterium]|nr:C25 family cysteine peptidase [Bacteroidota bacterium]MCL2303670.1 C25 family cysteine peptidase [Lentimicrobiaceae bacterium]